MTSQPNEVVVVHMNEPEASFDHIDMLKTSPINLVQIVVESRSRLCLAQARNIGAATAKNELLIFLDVDCLPETTFSSELLSDLSELGGVVMGTPRYLNKHHSDLSDSNLFSHSHLHDAFKAVTTKSKLQYNLFWSLCFAITKTTFELLGGFDEQLEGYGGEDTDFSWNAERNYVELFASSATVFHQPHASCNPPLNHFDDIVKNATLLHQKWNRWPMDGWLNAFEQLGLIKRQSDAIEVIRQPTANAIQKARENA